MRPVFHPFGAQHFVPVALIALIAFAFARWGRAQPPARAERAGRVLGVVLLVYYALESIVRVTLLGMRGMDTLPFELCSALFFIGAFAFWTGSALAFDVVYFWTFAGTLHAMITPTPRAGFPDPNWFQYFLAHGLLIVSAVYASAALRRTPRRGSLVRAYLALQAFLVVDGLVDLLTGENYFYLRYKPPSPTLLDALGPWPTYLAGGELVALVSFALWNLPFALARRRAATPLQPGTTP